MRLQHQLHDALERRDIAADADLAILAGDPRLAEGRHLDRILRCGKALERALAQRVEHDDRHAAARRVVQLGQHPRAVGARVLADDEDRLGMREIVEQHGPLPIPMLSGRPTLVGSWHMFEQSGKLFVPKRRTNSWYMNAASFEVRPEV